MKFETIVKRLEKTGIEFESLISIKNKPFIKIESARSTFDDLVTIQDNKIIVYRGIKQTEYKLNSIDFSVYIDDSNEKTLRIWLNSTHCITLHGVKELTCTQQNK